MTLTVEPAPMTSSSGALLPLVALPQGELLTVNEENIPLHYHTGIAEGYTLSGSWHYLEYPDQLQTAGSYLYEPAGSVHTFVCPESNTEDTVIFIRVEGGNVNFTEDGQFHSILDSVTIRHLTATLADARGLRPVNYLGGGAAGYLGREA
jgi:2,4'-dihydroxyacetophenone dioxygenase